LASAADIVATAQSTGSHTVLAEALTTAGLVETLQGTGPFTVFAPTDDAFTAALSALGATKAELLARPDLADILKYHVLSGKKDSSDLSATQTVTTVNGLPVMIHKDDAGVKFASAKVTGADVAADNGVIHVIDTVIIPPTVDIVGTAIWTGNHGVLAEALTKADLVSTLQGAGPFTVFAPTDAAFTAALATLGITKQELLDRADLADILKYHVLGKTLGSGSIMTTQEVATLHSAAKTVTITKGDDGVKFGGAAVTSADVAASNGVIHVIDAVVLPPADSAATTSGTSLSSDSRSTVAVNLAFFVVASLFCF